MISSGRCVTYSKMACGLWLSRFVDAEATADTHSRKIRIFATLPSVLFHHGVHSTLHVHGRDQGYQSMVRRYCRTTQHDWLLESYYRVVKGNVSTRFQAHLLMYSVQLLIPWRFFRLWALADDIDPPENMVRCMANNYSASGFWRSWHRSYNLWLIRWDILSTSVIPVLTRVGSYIYIPLGGTKHVIPTKVLIFSFVALWHDLSIRLLAWGWLVSLFILPEICARYLLPPSKVRLIHVFSVNAVDQRFTVWWQNLVQTCLRDRSCLQHPYDDDG